MHHSGSDSSYPIVQISGATYSIAVSTSGILDSPDRNENELIKNIVKRMVNSFGFEIHRRVIPRQPLLSPQRTSQSAYFSRLLEQVSGVRGDIVECGVGRGVSMLNWCSFLDCSERFQIDPKWPSRNIWGFDSFEGLPDPVSLDVNEVEDNSHNIARGTISDTSVAGVLTLLTRNISEEFINQRVRLVPGWFEDTISEFSENIALLHIDVDLHDSYAVVLENLFDNVVSGGIIAFDEYKSPWDLKRFPGASVAIDEFFAGRPGQIERDPQMLKWYYVKP